MKKARILFCLATLPCLLVSEILYAGPIDSSDYPSAFSLNRRQVARTPNGTLWAVYDKETSHSIKARFAKSADNGSSWSDQMPIVENGQMGCVDGQTRESTGQWIGLGDHPSIAVDSQGTLHAVFFAGPNNYKSTYYTKMKDGCWTDPIKLPPVNPDDPSSDSNGGAVIGIDGKDRIHISWIACVECWSSSHHSAIVDTMYDGIWNPAREVGGSANMFDFSMEVGPDNNVHYTWNTQMGIGYAKYNPETNTVQSSSVVGYQMVLMHYGTDRGFAVGPNGDVAIAYMDLDDRYYPFGMYSKRAIWVAYNNGSGSWETKKVNQPYYPYDQNTAPYDPMVYFDAGGTAHVVYQATDMGDAGYIYKMNTAHKEGAEWKESTITEREGQDYIHYACRYAVWNANGGEAGMAHNFAPGGSGYPLDYKTMGNSVPNNPGTHEGILEPGVFSFTRDVSSGTEGHQIEFEIQRLGGTHGKFVFNVNIDFPYNADAGDLDNFTGAPIEVVFDDKEGGPKSVFVDIREDNIPEGVEEFRAQLIDLGPGGVNPTVIDEAKGNIKDISSCLAGCPGDYNRDCYVNKQDWRTWGGCLDSTSGPCLDADGNTNSVVDAADYVVWRKADGKSCPDAPPAAGATSAADGETTVDAGAIIGLSPVPTNLLNTMFNPTRGEQGRIACTLATPSLVNITITDINGNVVKHLSNGDYPKGQFQQVWDGRDETGHMVASGVYLLSATINGEEKKSKIIVVK